MAHIGQQIQHLREERNWTMAHLADLTDLTYRTIAKIERTGEGRYDSVRRLLNAMGYDIEVTPIEGWEFRE